MRRLVLVAIAAASFGFGAHWALGTLGRHDVPPPARPAASAHSPVWACQSRTDVRFGSTVTACGWVVVPTPVP